MHAYVSPSGGVYLQNGGTSNLVMVMDKVPERGTSLIRLVREAVAEHQGWTEVDWKLAVGVSDNFWYKRTPE